MRTGEILVSQWGHEQTNVCFYEVLKTTEKFAWLVRINKKVTPIGCRLFYAMPLLGSRSGQAFCRKILSCAGKQGCRITDYEYARLWDGNPNHGSLRA